MHKKSKIALVLASLLAFNTHNNLLIMQIYMESMIVSFFFWFN